MTDISLDVANDILRDKKGANYYQDPSLLAKYLGERYHTLSNSNCDAAAKAILSDFNIAFLQTDPEILADYIKKILSEDDPDNN